MPLPAQVRIIASADELKPLAVVLAAEMGELLGEKPEIAAPPARAGDIVLNLDASLSGEAYRLEVSDRVQVHAGNYTATAAGTATLLQLLDAKARQVPCLVINDQPRHGYRGVMIDVARQPHSLGTLREVVNLCRLYKVRYLHLHLNDNEGWTFPSSAYPRLGTANNRQIPRYPRDELQALVRYADERGVTIIPELETPGHFGAAIRAMPEVFGYTDETGKQRDLGCMNMASPAAYEALDTIIGELCDVFSSSPYVHIGCDEVWLEKVQATPEARRYREQHGLKNGVDMYLRHIVLLNEMVRKRGRQTIVWEGFHKEGSAQVKIPQDILVMPFENTYNNARSLTQLGYSVINTAWRPLYVTRGTRFDLKEIHDWNVYRFGRFPTGGYHRQSELTLEPTPLVIGAQICCWEQPEETVLPALRQRLPALAERLWSADRQEAFPQFAARLATADQVAARLLRPLQLQVEGLLYPADDPLSDDLPARDTQLFADTLTVSAKCVRPLRPGETIRYTIDGSEPVPASPEFPPRLTLRQTDTRQNAVTLKMQLFRNSEPVGGVHVEKYRYDVARNHPPRLGYTVYALSGEPKEFAAAAPTGQELDSGTVPWSDLERLPGVLRPRVPHAIVFEGRLNIPDSGEYAFRLRSQAGPSQLWIDNERLIDRTQSDWSETVASTSLEAGEHAVKLVYLLPARAGKFVRMHIKRPEEKGWNRAVEEWLVPLSPAAAQRVQN